METINNLKIIGIDPSRAPVIRKEPYIELYFKLNHTAPREWVTAFNDFVAKGKYPVKIKQEQADIIETWVRTTEEVEPAFEHIKSAVHKCIENHASKLLAQKNAEAAAKSGVVLSEKQIKLNTVIDQLKFETEV